MHAKITEWEVEKENHNASTGSKLISYVGSALDKFSLSMHVEITTNLAKLRSEKHKGNLIKACKVKT